MARKPSHFLTVSGNKILFGGGLMERAEHPAYLFASWDAKTVTLHREEDYEQKNQGIYKVGWFGRGKSQAQINAKTLIEAAGLADGRYMPIEVTSERIVFATTPTLTPDQYALPKKATS